MTDIRAIETSYKGYRFRSRLEARWAVFLDAMGFGWDYEPEGFNFGSAGRYLPDFYLPRVQMWAEVKPGPLSHEELQKAYLLANRTSRGVILLEGIPDIRYYYVIDAEPTRMTDCLVDDHCYYYRDEKRFYMDSGDSSEDNYPAIVRPASHLSERYMGSICSARSARFEFGEKPNPNILFSPPQGGIQ